MRSDTNIPDRPINPNVYSGLIVLVIGALLLFRQLDILFLPHWLFRWPSLVIIVGLFVGAKSNYTNVTWLIIVVTGVVFMIGRAMPGFNVAHFAWPMVIIACGIWFIVRREHKWKTPMNKWDGNFDWKQKGDVNEGYHKAESADDAKSAKFEGEGYIDITAIFNNAKKTILSKDFKGGEVVNVFGNTQLNFLQADIEGNVTIDISLVFSKTTFMVPADWRVIYNSYTVFADFKDRRLRTDAYTETGKTLIIKGSTVFSQLELRNY